MAGESPARTHAPGLIHLNDIWHESYSHTAATFKTGGSQPCSTPPRTPTLKHIAYGPACPPRFASTHLVDVAPSIHAWHTEAHVLHRDHPRAEPRGEHHPICSRTQFI